MAQPPSEAELLVLKLFWRTGPMSAREVQDLLEGQLDWNVSTTRTVLERMKTKGLIARKTVHGVAVYAAARGKVEVLGSVVRRLMRNVLEVDGVLPTSAFSGSALLTGDELAELETLLNAPEA